MPRRWYCDAVHAIKSRMDMIEQIAEARIEAALERGELDELPGMGRPLADDPYDPLVPPEMRMALKVLKNAGLVPADLVVRREIAEVEQLLAGALDDRAREGASRRLDLLYQRLGAGRSLHLQLEQDYFQRLRGRLSAARSDA